MQDGHHLRLPPLGSFGTCNGDIAAACPTASPDVSCDVIRPSVRAAVATSLLAISFFG